MATAKTEKVYITTFEKGQNQGTVISLGIFDLNVFTDRIPVITRNGCISGEITRDVYIHFVVLRGREFVVGMLDNSWRAEKVDGKWEVSIPRDLADEIKPCCPHCHRPL